MKRLIVCGDSSMTPSIKEPGTHFSEIIANKFDYELITYARGGMSNLGICLQLEEAIEQRPDLILFNVTNFERFEIPLSKDKHTRYNINDVIYKEYLSSSSHSGVVGKNKPEMIVDTLYCLLTSQGNHSTYYDSVVPNIKEIKNALRYHFEFLYCPSWKKQVDHWGLYACLHKLHISNIPYMFIFPHEELVNFCPFMDEKNVCHYSNDIRIIIPDNDPGYHTTPTDQIIISQKIINHFTKYNILGQ